MSTSEDLRAYLTRPNILELIDCDKYDLVYKYCEIRLRHSLTDFLLNRMNIDPLVYMTCVPAGYASGVNSITKITIPENITRIGDYAFYECVALEEVYIPETVTSISSSAFQKCKNLKKINIPSHITTISEMVFRSCTSLESIVIPNSVTTIGRRSFRSCGLKDITIPEGVTSIEEEAFFWCTRVETIHIPASVVNISKNAFSLMDRLSTIYYNGTKEQWKSLYDTNSFIDSYFTVQCSDGQITKKFR